MKKILFYTDTQQLGGAENQMLLLAKFLPKDEFEVTLACSQYQALNGWCQQFMDLGCKVMRLHVAHKHDPRHYLYLKKILPQFDLLHLHVWNPASCRYAFLAAGKNMPVIVTEHDPFVLRGFKGWLKNKLTQNVVAIITASSDAARRAAEQNEMLKERVVIVPNGIDVHEWQSSLENFDRMEFRRSEFQLKGNEKIIMCVAELHERKGQKYLIDACVALRETETNFKLIFVGEGPAESSYRRQAQTLGDGAIFLGRRKDIPQLMAAADVFVLPSVREAFGLVLLEAGSLGLPIIASNVGGVPDIIEDKISGVLVASQSPEQLSESLKELLENPEKARRYGAALQKRVEKLFTAAQMAHHTAQLYDAVLMKNS